MAPFCCFYFREQAQFEVEFKQFHAQIDAIQEKQNKLLVMVGLILNLFN